MAFNRLMQSQMGSLGSQSRRMGISTVIWREICVYEVSSCSKSEAFHSTSPHLLGYADKSLFLTELRHISVSWIDLLLATFR